MSDDRRKISKRKNLEEVKQNLYQAEAAGDKVRARMWKSVLDKLLAQNSVKK
jgi:hypothetical protein